jgi:hypothetical protein
MRKEHCIYWAALQALYFHRQRKVELRTADRSVHVWLHRTVHGIAYAPAGFGLKVESARAVQDVELAATTTPHHAWLI